MNLVEQYFPKKIKPDEVWADSICLVKHFYGSSKEEIDEMDIPEFLIYRNYAIKFIREEREMMSKMFSMKKSRGNK